MNNEPEFNKKTVIITGAGQGIGLCIAQTFLRQGANVVIAEVKADLKEKAEQFLNAPDRLLFVQTDCSDEAAIADMMQQTLGCFGRIDCVIHNAGVMDEQSPVDQLDYAEWQRRININLSGAFLLAKHGRKQLEQYGGAMVFIASTRALMSESDTEAYSASKGGLISLAHALAISFGPKVRVNCVSPGWIVTDRYQHGSKTTTLRPEDHAQQPAGRVGAPEDIAEMVLYLCSNKAGFITGQNFVVDGGMVKKMIYS